jgi:hypothetical protein
MTNNTSPTPACTRIESALSLCRIRKFSIPSRIYILKHKIFGPLEEKDEFLRDCEMEKELHQMSLRD